MINKNKIFQYGIKSLIFFLFIILIILLTKIGNFLLPYYYSLNSDKINKDIVIVALDSKTLNSDNFHRYQDIWREDYAQLLQNILYQDPKIVGVDVTFVQKDLQETTWDIHLKQLLKTNKNLIFSTVSDKDQDWNIKIINLFGDNIDPNEVWYVDILPVTSNFWNTNLELYWELPLYFLHDSLENSWSIMPFALKVYNKINPDKKIEIQKNKLIIDGKELSYFNSNSFNINFFSKDYTQVSFIDVLDNKIPSDVFKNKIVLIWATSSDIHDEFLSPLNPFSPISWVILHANAINTLTSETFVSYPNDFLFLIITLIFLIGLYIVLEKSNRGLNQFIIVIGSIVFIICFSIGLFLVFWILWNIIPFLWSLIILISYITIEKYRKEKKSKDEIKTIFQRYISEDVVTEIMNIGLDKLELGGDEKEISVFFSDLAGFTDLSENLKPKDLWKILNIYFEKMSSIILDKKGTIDKFIWDAIMAFWNAPLSNKDHPNLICEAALLQREVIKEVNEEIKKIGVSNKIDMRIGINTWKAVIWNFWCSKRYDYTALWDTVNLASRLESINKQYWTNVMINETTYDQIDKERFVVRELDMITVKWKEKPVKIYELLLDKKNSKLSIEEKEEKVKIKIKYEQALNLYRKQEYWNAINIFTTIADNPSKIMIERCNHFILEPNESDWDGVYRFKIK